MVREEVEMVVSVLMVVAVAGMELQVQMAAEI